MPLIKKQTRIKSRKKRKIKLSCTKIKLSCTIVTAADSKYFVALQYLIASIQKLYSCKIVCFDLGLRYSQIEWLNERNVHIKEKPELIVEENIPYWHTWNKPLYIQKSGARKILWLDADCVILDSIEFIDEHLNITPVGFADTGAIKYWGDKDGNARMRNRCTLSKFNNNEYPNAGVFGLNLSRTQDQKILKQWIRNIERLDLRSLLAFFDQGALQHALEELNKTDCILQDDRYNFAISNTHDIKTKYDFYIYLQNLKNCGIKIAHFLDKYFYQKIKFDEGLLNSLRKTFVTHRNFEDIIVTKSGRVTIFSSINVNPVY